MKREISNFKKDFIHNFSQSKLLYLNNQKLKSKIYSLKSFFFEKKLKFNFSNIKIRKTQNLNFLGEGFVEIDILKNSNLNISFKDEIFFLKINLGKNCNSKISIRSKKDQKIFCDIKVNENSKCDFSFISNNSNFFLNRFVLKKNSNLNIFGVCKLENNKGYVTNQVFHKDKFTNCEFDINCFIRNSTLINEGLINIDKKSFGCSSKQNLQNFLLDENSNIFCEPILEVYNNDVICSHRAHTIHIKNKIKNYLCSKGIEENQIENIIFNNLCEKVKI